MKFNINCHRPELRRIIGVALLGHKALIVTSRQTSETNSCESLITRSAVLASDKRIVYAMLPGASQASDVPSILGHKWRYQMVHQPIQVFDDSLLRTISRRQTFSSSGTKILTQKSSYPTRRDVKHSLTSYTLTLASSCHFGIFLTDHTATFFHCFSLYQTKFNRK